MLDIYTIQMASRSRMHRWHDGDSWSLAEWTNAMCGEAGEAANVAKKIRRLEGRMRSMSRRLVVPEPERTERAATIRLTSDRMDELKPKLAKETCDAILYGICILNELGLDAETVLRQVFNEKSEEYGFPERI